jgi:hypothetical protein
VVTSKSKLRFSTLAPIENSSSPIAILALALLRGLRALRDEI